MNRLIALILAMCLVLCGCGAKPEPTAPATEPVTEATTQPTTEPTTQPTTEPTTEPPPVYVNPLNGEILDEPFTGRIYAFTISNIRDALPHVSVNEADILMEMFVNYSIIRCLALYTDISDVEAIGSIRSTRLMFNDIAQHYNLILHHAAGSSTVLTDLANRGVDNINLDTWKSIEAGVSYRDKQYRRGYEHSLFGIGPAIGAYAETLEIPTAVEEEVDYGLSFTEDGTPANGETADIISVMLTFTQSKKETIMKYNPELGKYVYWQYDKEMVDQITGEPEAFRNVIIMNTNVTRQGQYHVADFVAGGDGYFACGGKLIPIVWSCESEESPFRFFTQDGEPLELGMGNTYIAIAPLDSPVSWSALEAES